MFTKFKLHNINIYYVNYYVEFLNDENIFLKILAFKKSKKCQSEYLFLNFIINFISNHKNFL